MARAARSSITATPPEVATVPAQREPSRQQLSTLPPSPDTDPVTVADPESPDEPRPNLIKRTMARPAVEHLMRAAKRFSARLGNQFAAAITYFSFLSLVPLLMLAFSIAGFVLAGHPTLLTDLQGQITKQIPGSLSDSISSALTSAINNRYSVLSIGLVVALYSGAGWMGNVRAAVQAQWRSDFDDDQEIAQTSFVKNFLRNLVGLVGLGLAIVVSLGLSTAGAALQPTIVRWLGLDDIAPLKVVLAVVPILLAMAADVIIFGWFYGSLAPRDARPTRKALVRGSIIAAVGFEILKQAITNLPQLFSGSATYAIFGNVIGLLFFFNLSATLVLFVAAWISTSGEPERKRTWVEEQEDEEDRLPPAPVLVKQPLARPKVAGILGIGALLGFGAARRRK
jgi:membrane protein